MTNTKLENKWKESQTQERKLINKRLKDGEEVRTLTITGRFHNPIIQTRETIGKVPFITPHNTGSIGKRRKGIGEFNLYVFIFIFFAMQLLAFILGVLAFAGVFYCLFEGEKQWDEMERMSKKQ